MNSQEEEQLLLEGRLENGGKGLYTGDGSVDIKGNPVMKHKTGNWKACPFILGTECCERLAYYGIASNLVTYLTTKLHQGNVSAARNVTTWQGTCYLTPLIGAVLADAYWGRYWTIAVFSTIYFIVEELKILVRMFPIWATGIVFSAVYAQISTMFVEQGMALNTSIGSFTIPPASLSTFDVVSVIVWVPIYDSFLVPIARRFTGKERGFSEIQRMGIGLFISILAMASAALVEIKRLEIARAEGLVHTKAAVELSILCANSSVLFGVAAEIFTFIGQLEFFYDQSPDAMRSLGSALSLMTNALGNYLSAFILTVATYVTTRGGKPGWIPDNLNEGRLDNYFWLLAGLSFLNLLIYVFCSDKYKSKKAT